MISALYTWRDVLAALVDNDISVVDASVDGIDAVIPSQSVLETIFGPRYDQSHSRVRLEHAPGASRHLPIHNVASGSQLPLLAVQRPLWSVLKQVESVPPLEWKYKCRVAAFASYKGGVGRTTTLFAVAASLLGRNPPPRVVIVDADAEAPGLTWMIPGAPERLSLIDLLALVHDADADWETALRPLITSRVPLNSATIEAPLGRVEYTFFPTVRDRSQLFPLPITPEHVVHGRGRAHAIAEILAFVGDCAGADIVLVDLRAGITELNSPFILDPRVQTVFVTSCGRQSVDGTLMVLDRIR